MVEYQVKFVEAIEEGRIVRVPEDYAIREGLLIIRKPEMTPSQERKISSVTSGSMASKYAGRGKKDFFEIDKFRRPLRTKNDVLSSLQDNFHWQIASKRKTMNLTRKQMASHIGIKEEELKMVENGVLPADDFVIINKIQEKLGLNLRKDGQNFTSPMRAILESNKTKSETKGEKKEIKHDESMENILGKDIEIVD